MAGSDCCKLDEIFTYNVVKSDLNKWLLVMMMIFNNNNNRNGDTYNNEKSSEYWWAVGGQYEKLLMSSKPHWAQMLTLNLSVFPICLKASTLRLACKNTEYFFFIIHQSQLGLRLPSRR